MLPGVSVGVGASATEDIGLYCRFCDYEGWMRVKSQGIGAAGSMAVLGHGGAQSDALDEAARNAIQNAHYLSRFAICPGCKKSQIRWIGVVLPTLMSYRMFVFMRSFPIFLAWILASLLTRSSVPDMVALFLWLAGLTGMVYWSGSRMRRRALSDIQHCTLAEYENLTKKPK